MYQVEYAVKAIELGSCSIGVRTPHGVVLACEKRVTSPLLEQSSVEKILEVDSHIGAAISGLIADARTLIDHARVECQNHRFTYDEPLRTESLTQAVCDLALSFGEGEAENKSKMSRPFGVSLLLGGVDADGTPRLFHTDPSGTFTAYDAHAIGSGAEGARASLVERYSKSMGLEAAAVLVVKTLMETMEDKLTTQSIEMATVVPGVGFAFCAKADVERWIAAAAADAKAEGAA